MNANDYPSRLLMQNYYDEDESKELVHISVEKDNPHLFEDELNIKEDDFKKVQEFIRKHYNYFQKYFDNEIDIGELRKRVYEA